VWSGDFENLDIKKLRDFTLTYRVRVGQNRITFETTPTGINIVDIDFKNGNTYKR